MSVEKYFVLKVPYFVKVTICGLEYNMLPNAEISFTREDLQRFADLGIGETIVIHIEPKEPYKR